jgi:ubiquinone/menaquinone biosynthesis C-methylase UbiE
VPKTNQEQAHFDHLAEATGQIWWGSTTPAGIRRLQRRARFLAEKLKGFKKPKVLELGCGTGAFSKSLLEETELSPFRLTSCDISPRAVRVASHRCASHKSACFEVADITSLHYESGIYDAVIGNSILHHLPLEISLKECFRVLKPGGMLWFTEPNMMNPEVAILKNIYFIGGLLQDTREETAFFRWPLAKAIRKVGFQNVRVEPFDFLHPIVPASLVNIIEAAGRICEKTPLLKEISGSLLISAYKLQKT